MCVCLWVDDRKFFIHMATSKLQVKGFQFWPILGTLIENSWRNEDSLAWYIYCDTVHPFIMVIYENQWHLHLFQMLGIGAATTCVNDLGLSWLGFESRSLAGEANALPLNHRGGSFWHILYKIIEKGDELTGWWIFFYMWITKQQYLLKSTQCWRDEVSDFNMKLIVTFYWLTSSL